MGQEIRVHQNSSGEVNRLNGILSSCHFATNAKNDIWVIVVMRQDVTIVEELAI